MQSISPKKLCELHQQNPVDLIDVRTPAEFGDVRASFARNIPLDRLDPKAVVNAKGTESSKPIYLICKSGGRSSQACKKFMDAGFQNVIDVAGGTLAWDAAGLPVIRGKKVISVDRQMRIVAGTLVLVGALLAYYVDPRWAGLSGFVGAGLIFAGVTDICPMMNVIARMPWNQASKQNSCSV